MAAPIAQGLQGNSVQQPGVNTYTRPYGPRPTAGPSDSSRPACAEKWALRPGVERQRQAPLAAVLLACPQHPDRISAPGPQPQLPGSGGRTYCNLTSQAHRELANTEAVTDTLIRRHRRPKSPLAAGGSYGGYMVAWMNGHGSLLRPMSATRVCTTGLASSVTMATWWLNHELGCWPWEGLAKYQSQSPHAFSRRTSDALVIHGRLDFACPTGDSVLQTPCAPKGIRHVWSSTRTKPLDPQTRRTRGFGIGSF